MAGFFLRRRRTATAAAVLLLFLLAVATLGVDGSSRSMLRQERERSYIVRPPAAMRLFGGYLPKVIPPSGPSEGHNSIGPLGKRKEELTLTARKP